MIEYIDRHKAIHAIKEHCEDTIKSLSPGFPIELRNAYIMAHQHCMTVLSLLPASVEEKPMRGNNMTDYIKRSDAIEAIKKAPISNLGTRFECEDLISDIPAVMIPESAAHGRLIDADALLLRLLTAESDKVYDYCFPCKEVLQAIKDSPTIIAAAEQKRG